jgi:hypothetical protein
MRYWWVNQNQTYKYEVPGGFMWSPFKNANGARNPFYDNMDKVQPGDLIFAYAQQQVKAIGVAQKRAYSAPKPASFENASFRERNAKSLKAKHEPGTEPRPFLTSSPP